MQHAIVELFRGLQGEGAWAGKPSIFIRYGGCNLRCQFGLKCENHSASRDIPDYIQEVIDNLDSYKEMKDLPVFPNYCDTYTGILPEFMRFWKTYTTSELAQAIIDLTNTNDNYENKRAMDLVFTGGEPMLFQDRLIDLLKYLELQYDWCPDITIETNGTMPLKADLVEDWKHLNNKITFSISPKISSANYTFNETCKPEVPAQYETIAFNVYLKYVVKEEADIKMVKLYTDTYRAKGFKGNGIFLMPCGGKADPGFNETQEVVYDLCLKYGYRFTPRLQIIKKNAWAV